MASRQHSPLSKLLQPECPQCQSTSSHQRSGLLFKQKHANGMHDRVKVCITMNEHSYLSAWPMIVNMGHEAATAGPPASWNAVHVKFGISAEVKIDRRHLHKLAVVYTIMITGRVERYRLHRNPKARAGTRIQGPGARHSFMCDCKPTMSLPCMYVPAAGNPVQTP